MPYFKCEKCGREFDRGVLFKRHKERKLPCHAGEYSQCLKCNKQFFMKREYMEHLKTCNGTPSQALFRSDTEPVAVKPIEQFTKEELYEEYLRARGFGRRCFEYEDDSFLKYITKEEIKENIGLNLDCQGVIDMFMLVNMNPNIPDNHNARYRDGYFEVIRKKGWRRIDLDDLVAGVLLKNRLRFYDIETQLTDIMGEAAFKEFDERLDAIESQLEETEKDVSYVALKERLCDAIMSLNVESEAN